MIKKKVWAVITNTDLTEGRGRQHIKHYCHHKATALRLARGAGVMGTNAEVKEILAYEIKGPLWWYPEIERYQTFAPVYVEVATAKDIENQMKLNAQKELAEQKEVLYNKLRELGITDEEIQLLEKN